MDSLQVTVSPHTVEYKSMDAQIIGRPVLAGIVYLSALCNVHADTFETPNFIVTADTAEIAQQVAETAEQQRRILAEYWLGKAMPRWSRPCQVTVSTGAMGAGGWTRFHFVDGEVLNWRMNVQGSLERILDSVIPHEVNHTVFASYFRRPLPRWADEGAATLFEHRSEKFKQLRLLDAEIRRPDNVYRLSHLLEMKDYPQDAHRMLLMYAQGYTLVDFLVQQRGPMVFREFLKYSIDHGWEVAITRYYSHQGISSLENDWGSWFLAGMPRLDQERARRVAAVSRQQESASVVATIGPADRSPPEATLRSPQATAATAVAATAARDSLIEQTAASQEHGGRQMRFVATPAGPRRHWSIAAPPLASPAGRPQTTAAALPETPSVLTDTAAASESSATAVAGSNRAAQRWFDSTPADRGAGWRQILGESRNGSSLTAQPRWFEGTGAGMSAKLQELRDGTTEKTPGSSPVAEPTGRRRQFDPEDKNQQLPALIHSQERTDKPVERPSWSAFAGQQEFF